MSPSFASASTKAGSFFSSPLWKRVFSSRDVAGLHRRDRGFGRLADAVVGEGDRPLRPMRATAAATGFSDSFGSRALRPAEMREQDHLAALVGDLGDGRRDALDARGVGDLRRSPSAR